VWQALLSRDFPTSRLSASAMSEWRHTFQLEASAVLSDLVCFYSRASFEEEVLGLPLRFTTNPATRRVDYVEADTELLSVRAFKSGAVPRSPTGEPIQACSVLFSGRFRPNSPILPQNQQQYLNL
jgi:hypothetical protein